jgi:2-oxoglutarate ferredoxin oxidoreductase subunit alpha
MTGQRDLLVRFAGTAGEGVLTVGELLGGILARGGHHVLCSVRYDAEVRGEKLSMSQVRVGPVPVPSAGDQPDILVCFGKEAVAAHVRELAPGGLLVYDDKAIDEFGDITPFRTTPPPGAAALPLSFLEMAWKKVGRTETKNMVILGTVLGLLGLPAGAAEPLIRERLGRKEGLVAANLAAVALGHAAAPAAASRPLPPGDGRRRAFLTGNQAVALGALAAGCRFFAGYPITPASEIMEEMARHLPRCGGTCLQLEDEMAALGAVLGASFGGAKALTATSGPGLSLMSELLGFGAMAELPAVVVDVQRGGPSTGLPTRPEQSDLHLAVFGAHGDTPRIVLAAHSVAGCFHRTVEAFNLAERCQTPVILLTDQLLGQSRATVELDDTAEIAVESRQRPDAESFSAYRRYRLTASGLSPAALPGDEQGHHLVTGLEHTEAGLPDYTPEVHRTMSGKRLRKIGLITEPGFRLTGADGARRLLVGWGSTCGVLEEAARRLAAEGIEAGVVALERLHPWPPALAAAVAGRSLLCVEMNFAGQLHTLLGASGIAANRLPWEGGPISVASVCAWVRGAVGGAGEGRDVGAV